MHFWFRYQFWSDFGPPGAHFGAIFIDFRSNSDRVLAAMLFSVFAAVAPRFCFVLLVSCGAAACRLYTPSQESSREAPGETARKHTKRSHPQTPGERAQRASKGPKRYYCLAVWMLVLLLLLLPCCSSWCCQSRSCRSCCSRCSCFACSA